MKGGGTAQLICRGSYGGTMQVGKRVIRESEKSGWEQGT